MFLSIIFKNLSPNKYNSGFILSGSWVSLGLISQKIVNFSCFLYLTQYNNKFLLYIARYLGIYIVPFIIIFVNYFLFQLIYHRKFKIFIIFIIVIMIFTNYNNFLFYENNKAKKQIKISIVQPNKSLLEKTRVFQNEYQQDLEFYSLFNPELFSYQKNNFIVWPETVINRWIFRIPDYREHLLTIAENNQVYLVIGAA